MDMVDPFFSVVQGNGVNGQRKTWLTRLVYSKWNCVPLMKTVQVTQQPELEFHQPQKNQTPKEEMLIATVSRGLELLSTRW
jgi:hypothetical protein